MSEHYEVPPERLGRWLERWADEHGPVERTEIRPGRVTFVGADGSLDCDPPFPPLAATGTREGFDPGPLLDHAGRDRVVGVLLVRLGGHAAGVFSGRRLVASKVGRRQVHGRHRAGGSSQQRFARRREGQARVALQVAADVVVVHFGEQYRQWNAAFDAGMASALGKPLITLHPEQHDHALKEVDRAALAVAREPEQVVDLLRYVTEGVLR